MIMEVVTWCLDHLKSIAAVISLLSLKKGWRILRRTDLIEQLQEENKDLKKKLSIKIHISSNLVDFIQKIGIISEETARKIFKKIKESHQKNLTTPGIIRPYLVDDEITQETLALMEIVLNSDDTWNAKKEKLSEIFENKYYKIKSIESNGNS